MCEPGSDVHDMSREARELEELKGMPDRRHHANGNGWKRYMSLVVALVVGMIIPQIVELTSGTAVSGTRAARNESEIDGLKERMYAAEKTLAVGGRWTSKEQMEYATNQADRISRIEIFDATLEQELTDIRLVLMDIQTMVREIDRRTK